MNLIFEISTRVSLGHCMFFCARMAEFNFFSCVHSERFENTCQNDTVNKIK